MVTCDNISCAVNSEDYSVERHEIVLKSDGLSYSMPNPDLCLDCASYLAQRILEIVNHMKEKGIPNTKGYEG